MAYRGREHFPRPAVTNVIEYIRACNLVCPEALVVLPDLLNRARLTHPDKLCAKDVYGAMVMELTDGRSVSCLSRNGMATATPKHLEKYNVNNLRKLAQGIKNPDDQRLLLAYLDKVISSGKCDDLAMNCHELAIEAECAWCVVGHNTNHGNGENISLANISRPDKRTTSEACPHLHAGCTERILLYNRPYVIGLMKKVRGTRVTVTDIFYYDKESPPVLTYYEGEEINNPHFIIIDKPDEAVIDIKNLTLFTQTCPCPTCAQAIVDFKKSTGLNLKVAFQDLSRYKRNDVSKVQGVDPDDIISLSRMIAHQVPLCWQDVNDVTVKWRHLL